jgi:hypothetical protein
MLRGTHRVPAARRRGWPQMATDRPSGLGGIGPPSGQAAASTGSNSARSGVTPVVGKRQANPLEEFRPGDAHRATWGAT